ncbi:hypothetical protein AM588_10000544 [Phytophthora nicotianae]|uniref:DDE-1 domain-containing protein n=1 Tax=Phytophthora nicotianae TaxID=4792 RepID=A0A0W8CHD8_PHYNI|nr:hypothetical protein AM588_10000544 [Phytophthora nicotianae]
MMAKFDPAFTRSRNYVALRSWTAQFLKRNRLVIRRVTHKGSKTRNDMQIWRPSVTGCRMLLLDSLKVHKMASIRETLETECTTQVQYIPPGVTALSQPMDVSVMRTFKKKIEDLYVHYHTDHPFPADAAECRVMLSFLVAKAWDMVKAKSIVKGFRKAKLLPIGPRDVSDVFATYLHALPEAAVFDDASDIEDESFDE